MNNPVSIKFGAIDKSGKFAKLYSPISYLVYLFKAITANLPNLSPTFVCQTLHADSPNVHHLQYIHTVNGNENELRLYLSVYKHEK